MQPVLHVLCQEPGAMNGSGHAPPGRWGTTLSPAGRPRRRVPVWLRYPRSEGMTSRAIRSVTSNWCSCGASIRNSRMPTSV